MIRMIQASSSAHAKAYFDGALAKGDYYMERQELHGRFHGKLAERLELKGEASREVFAKLCDNINPNTGESLTPRQKQNRRIGYDINFHCPKSVSIVHALSKDDHVLSAFQTSVLETMRDIEADTATRMRKGGQCRDVQTGELAWAEFTHQTSRPTEGALPDPLLHSHCFVFNATWDNEEQRIKAATMREVMQELPYYNARFQKRLADRLVGLGYQIRRTDKSFEIEGVPKSVIDLFSKRTKEIEKMARDRGITDRDALDKLGARTRGKKQKGLTMDELKADWKRQMQELAGDEKSRSEPVRHAPKKEPQPAKAVLLESVDHAVSHCFERSSVVSERRLAEAAYAHAFGRPEVSLEALEGQLKADSRILRVKDGERTQCTTKGVLLEEKRMVELARAGVGKMAPLYKYVPELGLNDQQTAAVTHVLTTTDRVSIVKGSAGAGKTRLMTDAVQLMQQAGKEVVVVAPTSQAARGVLRDEGFASAETVASFLVNKEAQERLKGQVLWVDEAGLLGTQDMKQLLEIATRQNARVILGGDTRQHSAVVRGNALKILNTVGGIKAAEVNKIMRQKNAAYREAVEDLSKGNVPEGFRRLDRMGAIIEVEAAAPNAQLVKDYLSAVKRDKNALIISPTHKQGDSLTKDIREGLRQMGRLGKKDVQVTSLRNLNLTRAERGDWRNYQPGEVVQFGLPAPGIKRGSRWTVRSSAEGKVLLQDDKGKEALLPLERAKAFEVFEKRDIGLAKGDKVRITRNGTDKFERRLNNGQTLRVASINAAGHILLRNDVSKATYTVDAKHGNLTHAHCITSHASQGKTVDEVFVSMPATTFGAANAKQFYVSVSRGKEAARIYTDDRAQLLEHACALGERQSAVELVAGQRSHLDYVTDKIRTERPKQKEFTADKQTITKGLNQVNRDYEPGL